VEIAPHCVNKTIIKKKLHIFESLSLKLCPFFFMIEFEWNSLVFLFDEMKASLTKATLCEGSLTSSQKAQALTLKYQQSSGGY
jgi:hypothetical protein